MILKRVKKHWFFLCSFIITLLGLLFRFYNYSNRWVLGGDQAHFALEARYALESFQLPLLGPFSSAGPFQTGGEWYWFVMTGAFWNMGWVVAPWVFLTGIYVLFIVGMILLGVQLKGKTFGLLLGGLSAVSTAQITQAANLSNQSPISLFAFIAVFCMVLYIKTKKLRYFFFIALSIGIASSIHLQGIALMPLLLAIIIFQFPGIKGLLLAGVGLLLPWTPVFYSDSGRNFQNTHNMIYYYFFEKNKASFEVLGRNWKNFIGIFIPTAWSAIIGGFLPLGYVLFPLSILVIGYASYKKKLEKEWLIIFTSVPVMFIILRYTRTPLFDSFYVFLHVFILLITAWVIFYLYQWKKIIGILLFLFIIILSIYRDSGEISKDTFNVNPQQADSQMQFLLKKYPGKKFSIYDYQFHTSAYSQALSLYLDAANKINDKGFAVGYADLSEKGRFQQYLIPGYEGGFLLIDMQKLPPNLKKEKWVSVTPQGIYNSGQNWYKK